MRSMSENAIFTCQLQSRDIAMAGLVGAVHGQSGNDVDIPVCYGNLCFFWFYSKCNDRR